MSDKKVKFRTSISGFNRDDVNGYIESLTAKHAKESEEDKKRIAALEEKVKRLEKELEDVENAVEAEKCEKDDQRIAELTEALERAVAENENLKNVNDGLKSTVAQYIKNEEENAIVWEKSSKFDKVSGQIGSLIVSANAEAESIIAQAKLKARTVSNMMIESTKEKLAEMGERYTDDITAKTAELAVSLKALAERAESYYSDMNGSVEKDCDALKESLEIIRKNEKGTEDNNE